MCNLLEFSILGTENSHEKPDLAVQGDAEGLLFFFEPKIESFLFTLNKILRTYASKLL